MDEPYGKKQSNEFVQKSFKLFPQNENRFKQFHSKLNKPRPNHYETCAGQVWPVVIIKTFVGSLTERHRLPSYSTMNQNLNGANL